MEPFDQYPHRGRELLGRPRPAFACRDGYGLELMQVTGQTCCAYCGVSLVGDYYRWLLMARDHVIPAGEAKRLGIPPGFSEDFSNLVLACSGCNGFRNRYRVAAEPRPIWTVEDFLELRDRVFADRLQRVRERRALEIAKFNESPWLRRP
jgi:5-methylcytosine-specific restriction endonuclease McrA